MQSGNDPRSDQGRATRNNQRGIKRWKIEAAEQGAWGGRNLPSETKLRANGNQKARQTRNGRCRRRSRVSSPPVAETPIASPTVYLQRSACRVCKDARRRKSAPPPWRGRPSGGFPPASCSRRRFEGSSNGRPPPREKRRSTTGGQNDVARTDASPNRFGESRMG